jgi:hypothetical protein
MGGISSSTTGDADFTTIGSITGSGGLIMQVGASATIAGLGIAGAALRFGAGVGDLPVQLTTVNSVTTIKPHLGAEIKRAPVGGPGNSSVSQKVVSLMLNLRNTSLKSSSPT